MHKQKEIGLIQVARQDDLVTDMRNMEDGEFGLDTNNGRLVIGHPRALNPLSTIETRDSLVGENIEIVTEFTPDTVRYKIQSVLIKPGQSYDTGIETNNFEMYYTAEVESGRETGEFRVFGEVVSHTYQGKRSSQLEYVENFSVTLRNNSTEDMTVNYRIINLT